jgi:hypothetical protein
MSFASSLHSPPPRKSSTNKDPATTATLALRNRSPPQEDGLLSASPPEDDDEPGWSKVRSGNRATVARGFEKRSTRGRATREGYESLPVKVTAFKGHKEGESQNWRSEPRTLEQQNEEGEEGFGDSGGGGEHSAEEFQAWIANMRRKPEEQKEDVPTFEDGQFVSGNYLTWDGRVNGRTGED